MAIDNRPKPVPSEVEGTINLPRLYPIVDASCFPDDRSLLNFAGQLLVAGITLLQYRNKRGSSRQMLSHARELRRMAGKSCRLIMNDRADLCLAAAFDGVHVGQDDLPADAVRRVLEKPLWMGVSTHNVGQLQEADATDADYVAIGPVYSTGSKANPDPVVGLDGVHAARLVTRKPLVAIGGITRHNARAVMEAGADSVAVISDLLQDPRRAIEEFQQLLVVRK